MSYKLFAPAEYIKSSAEERKIIANGCGTKFDFVPDKILWRVNIKECCQIHDFCYASGETFEDKATADRIFLNNMLRAIDFKVKNFLFKRFCKIIAIIYYLAVYLFGGPAFWNGKNSDFEEIDAQD